MKYMGSKNRIAKHILPIMLDSFEKENCKIFIDTTVGGANLLDKVPNTIERYGNDINPYLIEMWKAVSNGWLPPKTFSEEQYQYVKNNKDENMVLTRYVGFALSYGGKWFGGWARGKNSKGVERNYVDEAYRNALKQFPKLRDVKFSCKPLTEINPTKKALIYADPPYKNTTKYRNSFDYESFYKWCRDMRDKGHIVFVSEYDMPSDFKEVWSKEIVSSLTKNTGAKKGTEKLFKL